MNGLTRHIRLEQPVMMWPIFAQLRRGPGDPTHRWLGDIHLRATRTPAGPALIKIIANGAQVSARAWGEGAEWSLDQLPRLLGAADDPRRSGRGPSTLRWSRHGNAMAITEWVGPRRSSRRWRRPASSRSSLARRHFGRGDCWYVSSASRRPGRRGARLSGVRDVPAADSRGLVSGAELAVPRCRGRAAAEPHPGPHRRPGGGFGAHVDWLVRAG